MVEQFACLVPTQEQVDQAIVEATRERNAVAQDGLRAKVNALIAERSWDQAFLTSTTSRLEKLEKAVADEESCRSSEPCLDVRAADPTCKAMHAREYWLDVRAAAQQTIARERTNPSGVVDLQALHQAGEQVQTANAALPQSVSAIAQGKAAFKAARHKTFSEKLCPPVTSSERE